ncbi:M50 family peptidase [Mycoavidus cysteinexigens]|uniref:M50 family peptidase n=1 Tax=Mycoavidus cysteinexigens TaxID=1553431 RepID=A0A2Z6EV92_9BURK|nr:site-2 protease family protein [Mycoavidus cysteinexigens]BBE09364.1 M50 family peptidase [Mycoavidus cysteinexigens]GAM51877.1 membrane metalloprotease [bacterium endosymbiont of Mortierella elongata FMR23-6]GLR01950.1 peptidase M50 [Mycoavidus cysteinexigens]
MDHLVQTIAVYALPVLFSITLHEAAHAYAARRFGDSTAYILGRVSLNPIKHIDPFGTIAMPLMLYFATNGAFVFGYAKPVPVAFGNLRNPRWHSLWVSLAGPGCNFAQAFVWAFASILLGALGVDEPFFLRMAMAGVLVNLAMCVFNLLPMPPLDGGRILVSLLPPRAALTLARLEPYGFFIVLALVMTGVLGALWLRPLIELGYDMIALLLTPFTALMR